MKLFLSSAVLLVFHSTAWASQLQYCNRELSKLAAEERSALAKLAHVDRLVRADFQKYRQLRSALEGDKVEFDRLSKAPDSGGNNYDLVIRFYVTKGYEEEMDPEARGSISENIKEYAMDKSVAGKFVAASRAGDFSVAGAKVARESQAPNFFRALQNSANVAADAEVHLSRNRIGTTADGARRAGRAQRDTYLGNLERGRWRLEESRSKFQEMLNRESVKRSPARPRLAGLLGHLQFAERAVFESIAAFDNLGLIHRARANCLWVLGDAGQKNEERMNSLAK